MESCLERNHGLLFYILFGNTCTTQEDGVIHAVTFTASVTVFRFIWVTPEPNKPLRNMEALD